jgi:hypothetical protein
MSLFPIILVALVLLLVVDVLRWRVVVRRELKRRDLVRVRARAVVRITPAKGFRVIESCTCMRDGKEYLVTIMNRGWFRAQPSIEVAEI